MFSKKQGQIGAPMGFRVGRDFEDALKLSPRIRNRGFLVTRRFESESSSSPKRSGG